MYSVTKHDGLVRSLDYFSRQVFSRDTATYKVVRQGDLAYATIHLDEGCLGLYRDTKPGLISPMYTVVEPDRARVEPEFLLSLMKLPTLIASYRRISEGSVHRRRSVSFDRLRRLEFELPPLAEQRAASSLLSSMDVAAAATEAVMAATKRVRDVLLDELLTRGVPGWHTEWKRVPGVGLMPACWKAARLGDLLLDIQAGRSPRCESHAAREDEWGVLKVSAISSGTFSPGENKALPSASQVDRTLEVKDGDLLVSRSNTPSLVGRSVLVSDTPPKLLLCDKTLRLVPNPSLAGAPLLNLLLGHRGARDQVVLAASGSSRSMYNVTQASLRAVVLRLPPEPERDRITAAVAALDVSVEMHRTEGDELRAVEGALADALLSGRARVLANGGSL